jgi:hypothetical protein
MKAGKPEGVDWWLLLGRPFDWLGPYTPAHRAGCSYPLQALSSLCLLAAQFVERTEGFVVSEQSEIRDFGSLAEAEAWFRSA